MSASNYLFPPSPVYSLPVRGKEGRYPVKRIFCVGRNYHAHAVEMGRPVDKATMKPFYFMKDASTLVESGATVPYPTGSSNYHYEMELVVAIGKEGFRVSEADADQLIYAYAAGLDMTRRDLQQAERVKQRPWDLGKDFENGAVIAPITPKARFALGDQRIRLSQNGTVKQDSRLSDMVWSAAELISHLSRFYHLAPGDLLYTGTPAGVGPVSPGDVLLGEIDGLDPVRLEIGPAE